MKKSILLYPVLSLLLVLSVACNKQAPTACECEESAAKDAELRKKCNQAYYIMNWNQYEQALKQCDSQ